MKHPVSIVQLGPGQHSPGLICTGVAYPRGPGMGARSYSRPLSCPLESEVRSPNYDMNKESEDEMSEITEEAHKKHIDIVVNGEPKTVEHEELHYERITEIAFPHHNPETIYSVTFEDARQEPPNGELV